MFLLLIEALPQDDLEVNLTGPLTSGTRRYSSGGLAEIQFRQIVLIATLRALVHALPTCFLARLWCV
jgi:hypothetical protein